MKVAFVGATRGMGRALARALAERGHQVLVVTPNHGAPRREQRDVFIIRRTGPR